MSATLNDCPDAKASVKASACHCSSALELGDSSDSLKEEGQATMVAPEGPARRTIDDGACRLIRLQSAADVTGRPSLMPWRCSSNLLLSYKQYTTIYPRSHVLPVKAPLDDRLGVWQHKLSRRHLPKAVTFIFKSCYSFHFAVLN